MRARITLALAVTAVAVFLWPGAQPWLQVDRAAVAGGELWRLVTGHFTHWSLDQLLWDTAVLVALGAVCERRDRRRYLLALGLAAVAIPAAVAVWAPGVSTYRGLSGLDSALFVLLAVGLMREGRGEERRRWVLVTGLALAGFAAKVLYEQVSGDTVFVDGVAGVVVVPLAHVAGGLAGLGAALWPFREAG